MIKLARPHRRSASRTAQTAVVPERYRFVETKIQLNPQQEFIAKLKAHDMQAYDQLVERFTPRLLSAAKRLLRNSDDAADAVQDSFLLAYMSIHKFRGSSSVFTWLYRILINCCLMKLRSQSNNRNVSLEALVRRHGDQQSSAFEISDRPTVDALEHNELRAFVRECISQLPKEFSEIVMLRDIQRLDTEQTAAVLGISRAAAKTRLHRARKALREMIETSLDGIHDPRIS